ncbi:MAG: EAL domain-containing protein [Fimbriimonadaceae bacterium]
MRRVQGFARLEPLLKIDNRWFSTFIGLIVFASLYSLGTVLSNRYENEMHRSIKQQLKSVASDASQFVNGDVHRLIREHGSMDSEQYREENSQLRRVLNANESIKFVYTCYVDRGVIRFGLDPTAPGDADDDGREDQSRLGEEYNDPTPALKESLATGKSVGDDKPYRDEWGTFISAYSPIFASDGSLEAVVGVDLTADNYFQEMQGPNTFRQIWFWGSLLFSVLSAILMLVVLNRVQKQFLILFDAKRVAEETNQELASLNRQLDWQSRTDALTGLLNREGFSRVVEDTLERVAAGKCNSCVLALMDLDNFKVANDHYGHVFGDQYLVAFAERIAEQFDGALLGRLGGDEFVLMIDSDGGVEKLIQMFEEFLASLMKNAITVGIVSLRSSVSVGVVKAEDGNKSSDLIRNADIAMYEAKRSGPGQIQIYDSKMGSALESRVEFERELRAGWERGEFWMAIQPIIDMKSGRTNAGELLMRWTREDGRPVSPMEFIPVAEETGLILEMGYWAIEEACRYLERLEREFPSERVHLSVNVAPRQLGQIDFVERLEEIVMKYSFHRGGLWLELTESSLINDHQVVSAKLNRIQAMGILIALDDFGTGYSSLSMLLDIPLDCLKIDRSFVMKLGESDNSEEVVRMILGLSEMLDLYVVAEGIETEEHSKLLRSMGCRWGQGFLYSKPVPINEFFDRISAAKKAA